MGPRPAPSRRAPRDGGIPSGWPAHVSPRRIALTNLMNRAPSPHPSPPLGERVPEGRVRGILFLGGVLGLLLALPACALERLEPSYGCYFGVNLGDTDTVPRLNARLGITPAVYVRFFQFPFPPNDRASVTNFLADVAAAGGIAMLSLEPVQGLRAVTTNACIDLGNLCGAYESQGIGGTFIRFAHERKGNWDPWGKQPLADKQILRILCAIATAINTCTAILMAPEQC